ncbi:MAG: holo-[acyl-carrier-protein] synthase [Ruminococcaceae bacterium]|nr:holo-[acyl-carrier-protein] synthase [Oscillospiraceae bacterium]
MIANGIDLIEISRIEKALKSEGFISKVYGESELKELSVKKAQSYAAAFCAKEALAKALGTGISGFKLNEAEVLHDEKGKPYFKLSGSALELAKGLSFALSITHTDEYAAAVVTAYSE